MSEYSNPALTAPEDRTPVSPETHPHLFGGHILGPDQVPEGVDYITIDPTNGEVSHNPTEIFSQGTKSKDYPGDQFATTRGFLVRKVQKVAILHSVEDSDLSDIYVGKPDDPKNGQRCMGIIGVGWNPYAFGEGAIVVGDYETLGYAPGKLDIWVLDSAPLFYDARYLPFTPKGKAKNVVIPAVNIPRVNGDFVYTTPRIDRLFVKSDEADNLPGIQQIAVELPLGVTVHTLEGPAQVAENNLLVWNKAHFDGPNAKKRKVDYFLWKDVPQWMLRGKLEIPSLHEGLSEQTA